MKIHMIVLKNNENLKIPIENQENNKNHRIPNDINENHENL